MDWTPYLSDSPERLAAWEFRLWVAAAILGALVIVLVFVARDIASNRSALLQGPPDDQATALNDRTLEPEPKTIEPDEEATTPERMARTTEPKGQAAGIRPARRSIDDVQANEFLTTLAGAQKGNLELMYAGGDPEVEALSERIEQLLWTAGWATSGSVLMSSKMPVGLKLIVPSRDATPPQVALQRALKAAGLPAPEQVDSTRPADSLLLVIGVVTPKQAPGGAQ